MSETFKYSDNKLLPPTNELCVFFLTNPTIAQKTIRYYGNGMIIDGVLNEYD